MKIGRKNIECIDIYSRGKNRDVYGNPYYAYKCVVRFKWAKDHCSSALVIDCRADWGSSGESDVFTVVRHKLERDFGIKIDWRDLRSGFVKQQHRTVHTMSELETPENWKVSPIK